MKKSVQEEIVMMRARGDSIRKIAQAMSMSATTVCRVLKELATEVQNAAAIERDEMFVRLKADHLSRMEQLTRIHQKLAEEVEKRSFSDFPTDKLISAWWKVSTALAEGAGTEFREEVEVDPFESLGGIKHQITRHLI
jgi:hypothetical protein